jgi:hypothetical protein
MLLVHLYGLDAIQRVSHNGHALFRLNDRGKAAAHHGMVIRDQDADVVATERHV